MHRPIFFSVLLITIFSDTIAQHCPHSSVVIADRCAAKLLAIGRTSSGVPKNLGDMHIYCNSFRASAKCLRSYSSRCLKTFPKQLTSIFTKKAENNRKKICASAKSRQDFLNITQCVRGNDSIHRCMDSYVDSIQEIEKKIPLGSRIPQMCCQINRLTRCLQRSLAPICGPTHSEYLMNFVQEYTKETMELVCLAFTATKCRTLPPTSTKQTMLSPYSSIVNILTEEI